MNTALVTIFLFSIASYQIYRLKAKGYKKEIFSYSLLFVIGYVFVIIWVLDIEVPSFLQIIQHFFNNKLNLKYPT